MRFLTTVLLGVVMAQGLDEPSLSQALTLGRGQRLDQLQQFHAAYRVEPANPTVMALDVITTYRRAVILAEQASRLGHRWTTRDLARALEPHLGRIAVHADVRLHPHNTFVSAPPYAIELRDPADRRIAPLGLDRGALYPPRAPREGRSLSAVSVEAVFEAAALDVPHCCDVVILDQTGAPVLRQRVALDRFR